MHTGKSYTLPEFLVRIRRRIYVLALLGVRPVAFYDLAGMKWPVVAWGIVFLLGATATLPAGFRNVQAYNRMHEASGWALSLQIIRMSTHRIGSKP